MDNPTGCEYCDNIDSDDEIGSCTEGCENSAHNMCPDPAECAGTHSCVTGGSALVLSISLGTATCAGCDAANEGPKIEIRGKQDHCTTGVLDHANDVDYSNGAAAVFRSGNPQDPMGFCNYAKIRGGAKNATVTWTGAGTWTPSEVKLEIESNYFYLCTSNGGFTPIGKDQSVDLQCSDV